MTEQVSHFPFAVGPLLPHAGPMLCIDRLLSSSKTAAVAEATLTPEHSLLREGILDSAAYVELAAQTAGAMQGYDLFLQGQPPKPGFLVGVQDFIIHGGAGMGDRLVMDVAIIAELGEMTVLAARVCRDGVLLAEGRLKVYVPK